MRASASYSERDGDWHVHGESRRRRAGLEGETLRLPASSSLWLIVAVSRSPRPGAWTESQQSTGMLAAGLSTSPSCTHLVRSLVEGPASEVEAMVDDVRWCPLAGPHTSTSARKSQHQPHPLPFSHKSHLRGHPRANGVICQSPPHSPTGIACTRA